MNLTDDTGIRISNDRNFKYRHKDNRPLAIKQTWKALDIFKMEGDVWWAVYKDNRLQMIKCLIQLVVIILSLVTIYDNFNLIIVLNAIILLLDIKLCYTNSSMSKIKLGLESQGYCNNRHMTKSPQGDVSMNLTDDTGIRISNDRNFKYRHKDNSFLPSLSL